MVFADDDGDSTKSEEKGDPDVMSTYDTKPPVNDEDVEAEAQPPKESVYQKVDGKEEVTKLLTHLENKLVFLHRG